jgi:hypothetical protein
MAFKSYTKCVSRADYENPDFSWETLFALLNTSSWWGGPVGGTLAGLSLLEKALNYMLYGKLICLGGDRCAIGRVLTVQSFSFPQNIDNDLMIDLLLYPSSLGDFMTIAAQAAIDHAADNDPQTGIELEMWEAAKKEVQGQLITQQPPVPMPQPMTPTDDGLHEQWYDPTMSALSVAEAYAVGGFYAVPPPGGVVVPAFHIEIEGSRVHDLLNTLQSIESLGLGSDFCDIPVIGWLTCAILKVILSPIILVALQIAWVNAEAGDENDPDAGHLSPGDLIVAHGRFVYDAGHSGWNELHPLKTIQKLGDRDYYPVESDPAAFVKRWCDRVSEVPPPDRDGPGGTPQSMTPEQQATWDAQTKPQNRWTIHPLIDGCAFQETQPEPPR